MAKLSILAGSTSQSVNVFVQDSTSTTGAGLAAVAPAGGSLLTGSKLYYSFTGANASAGVAVSLSVLAAVNSAWSSAGIVTLDGTNMIGWVRIDIPDAALTTAKGRVVSFHLYGGTNMAPCPFEIELTGWNNQDGVRGGLTALPNAAAAASGGLLISGSNAGTTTLGALTVTGATTLTGNVALADGLTIAAPSTANRAGIAVTGNGTGAGIIATSGNGATGDGIKAVAGSTNGNGLNLVGAGTANGLLTTGGAGAGGDGIEAAAGGGVDIRGAITGNITGALSGAVGSVTGAVGSVTGAVGSVTGAVGSVTGAVGSVTGNVGGNVVGTVASVVGAVGSVTGAVGSVTGNVGGNVTGSVGSLTTNNDKTGYALGLGGFGDTAGANDSITAAMIKTDAIDADALAANAVTEIAAGVFARAFSAAYGSLTFDQMVKVFSSALGGVASGLATTTATYRNLDNSADVIVATVDANGNRSAVTLTP